MVTPETAKKSNPIWRLFSSVRLTIVILIILAIVSIVGSLIPQRESALTFAQNLSPGTFKVFSFLDLFDMYHAVWFRFLIGILALNLIICSVNRFPGIWKRFKAAPKPDRQKPFQNLPPQQSFIVTGQQKTIQADVEHVLRKKYRHVHAKKSGRIQFLYGEKGRFTHFGFYLVHLSILIILFGAIISSIFGFEAYVDLLQGTETNTLTQTKNMAPIPLKFAVRCDRFSVAFYKDGTPKEYRSDLSFIKDGKVVKSTSVRVNHPARFNGITFYQASYGITAGNDVRLKIVQMTKKPASTVVNARKGAFLPLPGVEGKFQVAEVRENFMNMGPAVLIHIQPEKGKGTSFWVFRDQQQIEARYPGLTKKYAKLNPSSFKPLTFVLERVDTRFYTGLQVSRDPGVPLVWTGCFLMVAGFFVTFFMSHRRIWIRISPEKGRTTISVAGSASKNPVGLQRELLHLKHTLEGSFIRKGMSLT